jgi:deoxyribodipyrimidine photo-lyase
LPSKEHSLSKVPEIRIAAMNAAPVRAEGEYVVYWMIAFRRARWNFALDRAIEWARELKKPLWVLDALRCDYRWASDRIHRFAMQGMADNARAFAETRVLHLGYVEPSAGAGRGLLEALAERACVVVTDDYPCFFLPRMVRAAAKKLSVKLEAVDSNGLLPLRATTEAFPTAYAFRRFLQKNLPTHFADMPKAAPLSRLDLPVTKTGLSDILRRWPMRSARELENPATLSALPIDHGVGCVATKGGENAARGLLSDFLRERLAGYSEDRNEPDEEGASGLSPYLHFGNISSHEIFAELMKREKWSEKKLALRATGSREGWWGVSVPAEAFLNQFVTWREVGFNFTQHRNDYDAYESLPDWARKTLATHARDEREYVYALDEFASAKTHDPVWNAAQRQLVSEGRMHNYLRMLWGKKILEWTRTPKDALAVMIELNNRYALDGRDPNSYSGIFWSLGRYDRPWGPERPIFGTVRFMSSENTVRKLRLKNYLRKYGEVR